MDLAPLPVQKFFDNNGRPLVGGRLFTYEAGTTNKIDTYTDQSGGSLNTNPIILDFRGECNVWLDPTLTYKFVLAPRADTDPPTDPIWSVDDISPSLSVPDLTQSFIGHIIWPHSAAEGGVGVTPVNFGYTWGTFARYSPLISYENLRSSAYVDGVINMARDSLFNGVNVGRGRNTGNVDCTAIGVDVLQELGAGEANTGVGYHALNLCSSGLRDTAVGAYALHNNSSGYENTAIGAESMFLHTFGSRNVAVGARALYSCEIHAENVAVGATALFSCVSHKNTAVGREAGYFITSGEHNVAVGYDALIQQTTGNNNTAVGTFACQGQAGATGGNNSALGWGTLSQMTTAADNVAIGYQALTAATTGALNVAVGSNALAALISGNANVAVGRIALDGCTTGENNTAIGDNSLPSLSTGTGNVGVGKDSNGTTTGTNNTGLGFSSLTAISTETNCTGVGYQSAVTGSNQVQLGNSSTTVYAYGPVQDRSDARDKADVRNTVLGLNFINRLRPVDFRWNYREDYGAVGSAPPPDDSKKRKRFHHGLIAQEVFQAMNEAGVDFGGYQDHALCGGKDVKSLGYGELVPVLIKAVQELAAQVETLQARITCEGVAP
jgi:hypothetical protein